MTAYQRRKARRKCTVLGACFETTPIALAAESLAAQIVAAPAAPRIEGAVLFLFGADGHLHVGHSAIPSRVGAIRYITETVRGLLEMPQEEPS